MTEQQQWPPPAGPGSAWESRWWGDLGKTLVRVRPVRLWGRDVWVDEHERVFCDGCWRFLPVDGLGRTDNRHRVGLPLRSGVPVPVDEVRWPS